MQTKPNLKDHVVLTNYVATEGASKQICLADHPLSILGRVGNDTWSAVFGFDRERRMHQLSYETAARRGLNCHQVRTWVPLRNLDRNRGRADLTQERGTGFVHVGRSKSDLQASLFELALGQLEEARRPLTGDLRQFKLLELMARYPVAAKFILDAMPEVMMIVHQVFIEGGSNVPIWVGTVRASGLRSHHKQRLERGQFRQIRPAYRQASSPLSIQACKFDGQASAQPKQT